MTYKEYDIQNVRDGLGAGTDRIVVGSDGRMYYTGTHYDSFGRIK
ncbi:ribonuclease domain-containing protein [Psychrobacter sp. HD31]